MTESVWVRSDAGPLVLVPRALLGHWGGTSAPWDGRGEPPPSRSPTEPNGSDFDRAHEIGGYAGALAVGDGWALAFGHERMSACWVPRADGGVLLCWVTGGLPRDDELALQARSLAGVAAEIPGDTRWESLGEFRVTSSPLVLFCSVDRGDDADVPVEYRAPRAEVELQPGLYAVDHAELLPTEERVVDLVRLRAQAG